MNPRLALLAAMLGCSGGDRGENAPPPDRTTAAITPAPQDPAAVTQRAPPPASAPQALLRAIEASTQLESDRVVFVFDGDIVPGYHVEYSRRPVRCGSGDPVSVQGAGQLVVRFEPARAHDDQGHPTLAARERTLGFAALSEWKLICDFEGQVELLLGVSAVAPYRVIEQGEPARLVLEVQHAP